MLPNNKDILLQNYNPITEFRKCNIDTMLLSKTQSYSNWPTVPIMSAVVISSSHPNPGSNWGHILHSAVTDSLVSFSLDP